MKIYLTRDVEVLQPYNKDYPIFVDQGGFIIDGNHRYKSHILYDTPLQVEVITTSETKKLQLSTIQLSRSKAVEYSKGDLELLLDIPIVVEQINGIYRVFIGNTRVYSAIEQDKKTILGRMIK